MSSPYDEYYNQSLNLQRHFDDIVDDGSHPQAKSLRNEMQELTAAFKSDKDPRHVEERLKTIEHGLVQARAQGEKVMSYSDVEHLEHQYRKMRESIRKLPNY